MTVTYQFPPDNSRMRAVSLVPWGSGGLLLPLWPKNPEVWRYASNSTLTSASIGGLATLNGFSGAAVGGASGAWLSQYNGSLVSYSSGGAVSGYTLPASGVYTGVAYIPTFGQPYVVDSTGFLFVGSGAAVIPGSGFGRPVWGLSVSGTTLFGLAGGVSSFSLSASAAGTSGFMDFPAALTVGLCLAASTPASAVAVGGWTYASLASGYSAMVFNAASPVMVGLSSGGGFVDLYTGTNDVWTLTQSFSGVSAPSFGAWSLNGLQLLVSDPVSGRVRAYNYAFLSLALSQTLNISGAASVAITTDGLRALVCQPSLNQITPLTLATGVWFSGAPISISSPQSILAIGSGQAFVGGGSGITNLLYANGWSPAGSLSVGFLPTSLISASGNILAAGSSGSSGFFVAASQALSLLFTYSWTGAVSGMVDVQSQIVVNDPLMRAFFCFGNLFTQYQSIFMIQPQRSLNGLWASPLTTYSNGGTIFGMASGSTPMYQMTAPYNVESVRSGVVGIRKSGSWVTATLGSGHVPTAVVFDTSGNVWAATLQNDLYQIGGTSGNIISSQTIPQYSGQSQAAPLGISAMTFLGSGLYGASSLGGFLVKLI